VDHFKETETVEPTKISTGKSFIRYNISAFLATFSDFAVLSFTHYVLGFYYVLATVLGACTGAVIAFFLGRNWAFMSKEGSISKQGMKFVITALLSVVLNTAGVAFFIEIIQLQSVFYSKLWVSILIGFCFNYPMQRFFVYRS